jgi:hypothetical protein
MSLFCWNCRGTGPPATVQELCCFVQTYRPYLVFLCETRQIEERVKNLRYQLGMDGCFHVKGDGKGGCLALYSQEGITVDLLSFSKMHILVVDLMIACVGVLSSTESQNQARDTTSGQCCKELSHDLLNHGL